MEKDRKNVKNIEWNTQIIFGIIKVYQFPSKTDLSLRLALLHNRDLVTDVLDRPCLHQTELHAFETNTKTVYETHYSHVFRVGIQYLVDCYNYDLAGLNYFISFFHKQEVVGVV